jgi:23S rRNA (cytosine1962-C5)-methyltransferase
MEGVPGLAVDRYADVAIVHADSESVLRRWAGPLRAEQVGCSSAYAKTHPRGLHRVPVEQVRRLAPEQPLWGPRVDAVEVREGGARYLVKPPAGLSVGLFLDMREVRAWLRGHAAVRTVLNLFAYTCSFGVSAALGGAARVLNLDLSRSYLEWGKQNYRLNGLTAIDRDFVYGDALDWLGRLARREARFDLVIVDPPSFSSTPFSVTRDYARLVMLAARVVAPTGILLAATNHATTSDERFDLWLRTGLGMAERHARLVRSWHEPAADFPVAAGRSPYLKVRALGLD